MEAHTWFPLDFAYVLFPFVLSPLAVINHSVVLLYAESSQKIIKTGDGLGNPDTDASLKKNKIKPDFQRVKYIGTSKLITELIIQKQGDKLIK